MKKDRRQINKTWEATNPLGEKFLFGKVGSGKNSYIKTIKYLGKEGRFNVIRSNDEME